LIAMLLVPATLKAGFVCTKQNSLCIIGHGIHFRPYPKTY
jgi:hypothetical protein